MFLNSIMAPMVVCILKIIFGCIASRLKVLVIRVWTIPVYNNALVPSSMELVLCKKLFMCCWKIFLLIYLFRVPYVCIVLIHFFLHFRGTKSMQLSGNHWWKNIKHLPLIEFAYNNNHQGSIGMAPYEALYGRKCQSPLCWFEPGEQSLLGPDLMK